MGDDYKLRVDGFLLKLSNGLIKIDSTMSGEISCICDISGDFFKKTIDDSIILFAKDGIWNSDQNDDYFDVIEFFDGYIDLDFIFKSELESIRLDYHIKE